MLVMANRRGRQEKPKGGVVNLTSDERKAFRERREKLGYTHRSLGAKAGVSGGTISNIETGASGQVNAAKYAAAYAVLFGKQKAVDNLATYKKMVEDLADVTDHWDAISEIIAGAKKIRT